MPRGTLLSIELVDPVDTGKSQTGEIFRARVSEGVYVQRQLAVPPGATVRGLVTLAVPSGRVKGRSKLEITLSSIEFDGSTYTVRTDTLSYTGDGHTGQHLGSGLMMALQGALYGVLFGGKDGAILGAGAGAGAGGIMSILKGKNEIAFPQGAKLMFETLSPMHVPAVPEPLRPPPPVADKAPTPAAPTEQPIKEPPKDPKAETKPAG